MDDDDDNFFDAELDDDAVRELRASPFELEPPPFVDDDDVLLLPDLLFCDFGLLCDDEDRDDFVLCLLSVSEDVELLLLNLLVVVSFENDWH